MNDTLKQATLGEMRLMLQMIERQGRAWVAEMPKEAAKEAAIRVRFDPDLWTGLCLKYKDSCVDTVGDLAEMKMILGRIIARLEAEGRPVNLKLARHRTTLEQQEADLER